MADRASVSQPYSNIFQEEQKAEGSIWLSWLPFKKLSTCQNYIIYLSKNNAKKHSFVTVHLHIQQNQNFVSKEVGMDKY